ncbi:hypothetical protein AX16_004163 [Volvariella volvacea WC 439]|nr:hypothetical protein AX16_004163 [Volvariella volvacea WC 439]
MILLRLISTHRHSSCPSKSKTRTRTLGTAPTNGPTAIRSSQHLSLKSSASSDLNVFRTPRGFKESELPKSPAESAPQTTGQNTPDLIEDGIVADDSSEEDDDSDSDREGRGDDADDSQSKADRMAREYERRLVLEAAGLLVDPEVEKEEYKLRTGKNLKGVGMGKTRRAPPPVPVRSGSVRDSIVSDKDLPPIPKPEDGGSAASVTAGDEQSATGDGDEDEDADSMNDHVARLEDAYDRYEMYERNRQRQIHEGYERHRMSVASFDTANTGSSLSPTAANFPPGVLQQQHQQTPSISSSTKGSLLGPSRWDVSSYRRQPIRANTGPVTSSSSLTPDAAAAAAARSSSPGRHGHSSSYSGLFSFLGRSRTPVEGDNASNGSTRKLVISGPILQDGSGAGGAGSSRNSSPSRAPSPALRMSWASLLDKNALQDIPVKERKRQEAIFELIETESAYVQDLQLIVEVFFSSMLPMMTEKECIVIFANIEELLVVNTAFLSALQGRQKECRLYIDQIGDILDEHMREMEAYNIYCVNQGNAIRVLKSMRDSNHELGAHLRRLHEEPAVRNLDLSSYLLEPMQRITRYPLLVKQILQYTEPGDERDLVQNSVDIAEDILAKINEDIREVENRQLLQEISRNLFIGTSKVDLTKPTRYMGPRRLIKEGPLVKAKSGRKLHGYLCNDVMVLLDGTLRTLYRMPIALVHAQVKEAKDDVTFQVSQSYPRGGDALALKAPNARECQDWIRAIENSTRNCRLAEDEAAKRAAARASRELNSALVLP